MWSSGIMRFVDLTGKRYGKLIVLERSNDGKRIIRWVCRCDCGNETIVQGGNLKNGHTQSCGCKISESNTKHGQWGTKLYNVYHGMKQRCYNPKASNYRYYGGRGITICDEWQKYEPFHEWAMGNGYEEGLSIDRIDNDGNYEPSNCRWEEPTTQTINQRTRNDNGVGHKGVSLRKDTGKYVAYISINKKRKVLGNYNTLEEATMARRNGEKELFL